MELFDEPLWNYAKAIQIDSHECKAVLQFAVALIQRLKLTTITDIGNELDFVKTIQNIASKDNIKVIPRKRISQTANRKELEQENALKNCKFMHSLSKYSLTIYEIIKMANILGEINDGQIWISPSDSEKLCDGKPKKEEIREQFKDNSMLQYAKVIEVEIAP
uniref:Phage protein n=1 Tax=Globodera pallida TaxID=36090 RepID=A0A183C5B3_GLOPA